MAVTPESRTYNLSANALETLRTKLASAMALQVVPNSGSGTTQGVTLAWNVINYSVTVSIIAKPWYVPESAVWSKVEQWMGLATARAPRQPLPWKAALAVLGGLLAAALVVAAVSSLLTAQRSVQVLEAQVDQQNAAIIAQQADIVNAQKEIASLQEQVTLAQQQLSALKDSNSALTLRVQHQDATIRALSRQLQALAVRP